MKDRKEYLRQYHLDNRERDLERSKKHYQNNKEHCKQQSIEWRKNNPEKAKEILNRSRFKNRDKLNARSREYSKEQRIKFPDRIKQKSKERYNKLRDEILTGYGGRCACCGESERVFLDIDHVNNDGNIHRKELKSSASGAGLYNWIKRNNFPDTLQLLCSNCNQAKKRIGYCPHQIKK